MLEIFIIIYQVLTKWVGTPKGYKDQVPIYREILTADYHLFLKRLFFKVQATLQIGYPLTYLIIM